MAEEINRTGLEIAVIGMAGRFPGAKNIEEFWDNLKNGRESIYFFTDEELEEAGADPQLLKNPNIVKANGLLEDIDCFDASFFSYTPKEADIMDPQMRIFHECVWHALEDAGYDPGTYNGAIGLYAGASPSFDWRALILLSGKANDLDNFALSQLVEKDYLSVRVSYRLNLRGPTVSMYTACSTSLVSIHLACQALLNGECSMALAGGVTISQLGKSGYLYQEGMIGSPDGHCRVFDAKSGGTIAGNGAGVVVLKRLEEAQAHGDYIYAIIKGTAVNNDGVRKVGFTAPSVEGQAEVIRIAQLMAEVEPESITYVEAHGTATDLGDPVEVEALKVAFNTDKKHFCAIGAVKSNMGHLDSASGVTGFIKTALCLNRRMIPPSLHYESPNPKIDFENSPFYVNTGLQEWKNEKYPLRAGVSSFGVGGTNAHMVLEEWSGNRGNRKDHEGRPFHLLLLSAKTKSALDKMTRSLLNDLTTNSENPANTENSMFNLADVAYTLQQGRHAFTYRKMMVCSTVEEAIEVLSTADSPKLIAGRAEEENRPVVFMFSGQGSQYVDMGRDIYQKEPVFRREIDRCFDILESIMGQDIKPFLYPEKTTEAQRQEESSVSDEKINDVLYSGPIKFAFEYSIARLVMHWGIQPYAMVGHSFGEYIAACLAGVFSLEDALAMVVLRGQVMEKTAPGAMMSVALSEQELIPLLGDTLSLAAVNTHSLCIVSGPIDAVKEFEKQLNEGGVETIRLNFPRAGHSKLMQPILPEFEARFRQVPLNKPQIPYISGLTGQWITAQQAADPAYWCRHMKEPIRFTDCLTTLLNECRPILVQMGSDRGLPLFVSQHPDIKPDNLTFNLVRHPKDTMSDVHYLLEKIGRLWLYGVPIHWDAFYSEEKRFRVPLPGYPFEPQRFPISTDPFKLGAEIVAGGVLSLSTRKPDMSEWFYLPTWTRARLPKAANEENLAAKPKSWLVFDDGGSLAARLRQQVEEWGQRVITVALGETFAKISEYAYTLNPSRREDYNLLVAALIALKKNQQMPEQILHFWSLSGEPEEEIPVEMVDHVLERGFYSLFYLARALGDQAVTDSLRIDVVTSHMQQVTGEERLNPLQAAILGPVKVIPVEYPNIFCRSIDILLPQPGDPAEDRLLKQLLAEFNAMTPEPVVAFRGSSRWESAVKPIRMEKPAKETLPFKEKGVYLVTGGLGGIGLVLAQHLAASVQAKLVLTGRTPFPEPEQWDQWLETHDENESTCQKIRMLQQIEAQGAEVLVIRADVSSLKQMQTAVFQALERFGTINGVIHCAGVPDGAAIQRRTREMTDAILAPKVKGTLVLDHLLKDGDIDLDFVVFCSSINAIVPAFGQLGHCSANAFLDAFALHRNGVHSNPLTVSINWNSWLEVGQAVEAARKSGQTNGLLSSEGVEVFDRILADTLPQVAVSTMDFTAVLERFNRKETEEIQGITEEEIPSEIRHQRPELSTEYTAPRDELEQALVEIWQKNFGFEKIGIYDNFFELGGDSLKGMMFVNQYKKLLGEIIHVTVVFNAPTIAELADYFTEHYSQAAARVKGRRLGIEIKKEYPHPGVDAAKIDRVRQLVAYPAMASPPAVKGKKNPPAIFILSPARSGSTLLRVMLAGHPRLFAPPELALLSFNLLRENKTISEGVLRAIMQIKGCSLVEAETLMQELKEKGTTVKAFYRLMQQWIGERVLVDKTPGYALDLNVLKRAEMYFENPLYIHLVRHPYGMIRSFEEARLDLFFGNQLLKELSLSRRELAELTWTISNQNILEFLSQVPEHRWHRVRFEQLVKDPEPVAKDLCRFLGVEFHPDMLNPYKEKKERMTDGIHEVGLMIGDIKFHQHRGINAAVADTWKDFYKEDFLGNMTRQLAESFSYELLKVNRYASIQPTEAREYYPLSFSQKQLYILQTLEIHSTAYNMTRVFSIIGADIDKDKLGNTFKKLIARHESLRTSFITVKDEPVQKVHKKVDFKIEYDEVSNYHTPQFIRPFDLSKPPLLRVGLIKTGEEAFILIVDIHHIISDATSHAIIERDFIQLYADDQLPSLRLQYNDYSLWQQCPAQQAVVKQQETWWLKLLSGEVPILNLPTDYPRPAVRNFEGNVRDFEVGKEMTHALRELAVKEGVTLNMLMLALFDILLSRLSGQEDIITGTSIKGRGHADLEDIIGVFINTLALRNRPLKEKTFWEFLKEVKEISVSAYENQDYPFEELVKKVWPHRDESRNPLFDVMFEMRKAGPIDETGEGTPGIKIKPLRYESRETKFDLDWMGFEGADGILFTVTYCSKLFKKETIEFMCNCYQVLIEEVVKNRTNRHLKIKDLRYSSSEDELKQQREVEFDF